MNSIQFHTLRPEIEGRRASWRRYGGLLTLFLLTASLQAQKPLESKFTHRPPRIDGKIDVGEWDEATRFRLENGYLAILNDRKRAYFLLNIWDQTRDDPADYLWLTFDVNRDKQITPEEDVNFALDPLKRTFGVQNYLGKGQLSPLRPTLRSSVAARFDSFAADGSTRFEGRQLTFRPHRVWETAIDLREIKSRAGGAARLGLRVASPASKLTLEPVRSFTTDFTQLLEVEFHPGSLVEIAADANAVLNFQSDFLEVTQSVQTRQNTIPLVAGKPAIARVYLSVSNTPRSQPVWVYLHGRRGGLELPGSPLLRYHRVPTTVRREVLADTPWFTLPDTWLSGTVEFQVRIEDAFDREKTSAPLALTFHPRQRPLIWIVPVNRGSATDPVVVSDSEIASQMTYLRATYPVADVDFVIQPWTVLGPNMPADPIPQLRTYHGNVVLAWLLGWFFSGSSPFDLPLQIYGFTPSGGGSSDPVWYAGSGHGYVARGYRGTSLEGTMAHEINHNLDRSTTGTWGRHVPGGCGAAGPDSAWPYANDDINEFGFDTRADLTDTEERSVIPSQWPDFMSYCQSGELPTKWISPYRYLALYNFFAPAPGGVALHQARLQAGEVEQSLLHISGRLFRDGTGRLFPILIQPGVPSEVPPAGPYALEFRDTAGKALHRLAFDVSFESLCEDEPPEEVAFDFQVINPPGTASIVLLFKDKLLDRIIVSPNAPTVTVTAPNGGEQWDGIQTISWKAADLDRGDDLAFTIQYSPDDGRSWMPVADRVTGLRYTVDTTRLPGSTNARIRLLATDGFHTAQDDSDKPFTVAGKPPQPFILQPRENDQGVAGQSLQFVGEAKDLEDGALPEAALRWTLGDQLLGTGRLVVVRLLEGSYEVTLTATDSAGNEAAQRVRFDVRAPLGRLAGALAPDGRVRLSWAGNLNAVLESATEVTGPYRETPVKAVLEGDNVVVNVQPMAAHTFYRLLLVD